MKNYVLLICFMMTAGMVSAQALKVASDGNVGVGLAEPGRSLHVQGDNAIFRLDRSGSFAPGFIMSNHAAVNTVEKSFYVGAFASGVNNGYFFISDLGNAVGGAGTRRFTVDNSGDVIVGTSTNVNSGHKFTVEGSAFKTEGGSNWNTLSDKKLKKNIKTFRKGLDVVMKLNPVEYEYNGLAKTKNGEYHIGVLAQDVAKVLPHMVSEVILTDDDGLIYIDEHNPVEQTEKRYLSMNDSDIKWILVEAMKEQQELIENLQSQITELQKSIVSNSASSSNTDVSLNDLFNGNHLYQNTPNPYNDETVIEYSVSDNASTASINFYNLNGQLIKTQTLQPGNGKVNVSSEELSQGTYTFTLEVDGEIVSTRKMVKMR